MREPWFSCAFLESLSLRFQDTLAIYYSPEKANAEAIAPMRSTLRLGNNNDSFNIFMSCDSRMILEGMYGQFKLA